MLHLAEFKNERSSKKRSVSCSDLNSHMFIGTSRGLVASHPSESHGRFYLGGTQIRQLEAFLVEVQVVPLSNVEVVEGHALRNGQRL
jgi:hypothetical protein